MVVHFQKLNAHPECRSRAEGTEYPKLTVTIRGKIQVGQPCTCTSPICTVQTVLYPRHLQSARIGPSKLVESAGSWQPLKRTGGDWNTYHWLAVPFHVTFQVSNLGNSGKPLLWGSWGASDFYQVCLMRNCSSFGLVNHTFFCLWFVKNMLPEWPQHGSHPMIISCNLLQMLDIAGHLIWGWDFGGQCIFQTE